MIERHGCMLDRIDTVIFCGTGVLSGPRDAGEGGGFRLAESFS